jgi:hypothetical protein
VAVLEIMAVKAVHPVVHVAPVLEKAVQVALEAVVLMAHYLLVEQLLQFPAPREEEKQRKATQVKVILMMEAEAAEALVKLEELMEIEKAVMV